MPSNTKAVVALRKLAGLLPNIVIMEAVAQTAVKDRARLKMLLYRIKRALENDSSCTFCGVDLPILKIQHKKGCLRVAIEKEVARG